MKRRRVIAILAGCVVAAILIAALWPREREPEYGGKKLSEWIWIYAESPNDEAADAVRRIGTNGLPWLLRWVRYEPPAWNLKVFRFMEKLPPVFLNESLMDRLSPYRGGRVNLRGEFGFVILGEQASPAVPELAKLINDLRRPAISIRAMECLGVIGEPARTALSASFAWNAPDLVVREAATNALGKITRTNGDFELEK